MIQKKDFLYIANWKNYFTLNHAQAWACSNKSPLSTLAEANKIVVCPSLEAMTTIGQMIKETPILLGAQNCSANNCGAFTGQVLAESLQQIGCSYCIIGHPETQRVCPENPQILGQKINQLWDHKITPLLCIGESAQDYELSHGALAIQNRLQPILEQLTSTKSHHTLGIAYEPLWAINSQTTPPFEYIEKQLAHIDSLCTKIIPQLSYLKLYGGGVDETNARQFKNIDILDGFLIGRASTDFQKLQKIVGL